MATTNDVAPPCYTREHVDACAFASWHAALQHVSIKAVVIPLPACFIALLLADGVQVPSKPNASDPNASDPSDAADQIAQVRLAIEQAIATLGGAVFPKLNWSSPRDASWMLGSLRCTTFDDVFLLLKASDFVVHDLTMPYRECEDSASQLLPPSRVDLVLKKWCNLYDSMLFRGFVVAHRLVGISQRHCDEFFACLLDQQDALCDRIFDFFHTHLKPLHRSSSSSSSSTGGILDREYIFDVYVDKRRRVFLLDINVFGAVTDPLLFSWGELLEWRDAILQARAADADADDEDDDREQTIEFRIVESQQSLRMNPLSCYRTPTDFVDHLAGAGGFDAFMDQVRRDNAAPTSDTDDSDAEQAQEQDDEDDASWDSDHYD